jgi:hypothetical protein
MGDNPPKTLKMMPIKISATTKVAAKKESEPLSEMKQMSKNGMTLYKKMYERLKRMKSVDKEELEKKKKSDMESEKKKEEAKKKENDRKKNMDVLLSNAKNIITSKLDNGDLIMFSGDQMSNALKTSYRYSLSDNSWVKIMTKEERELIKLPKTKGEMDKKMAALKEETVEYVKKEMEYDFSIMLALLEKTMKESEVVDKKVVSDEEKKKLEAAAKKRQEKAAQAEKAAETEKAAQNEDVASTTNVAARKNKSVNHTRLNF